MHPAGSVTVAAVAAAAAPQLDWLSRINGSKLLWGMTAMVFNLGARFIVSDMTPAQQRIFQHPLFKRIVVFCMIFASTRDVLLSAAMAAVFNLMLEVFLNEHSRFGLIRSPTTTAPVAVNTSTGLPAAMLRDWEHKLVNRATAALHQQQQPEQDPKVPEKRGDGLFPLVREIGKFGPSA